MPNEIDQINETHWAGMIEDILELESGLTEWEMEFIDAMQQRILVREILSSKMKEVILRIFRQKVKV